ncbi:hypothetical protein BC834DRAFT_418236 [Gloeopeniophorella convolvens]|nr:hypothetical protein BC834DRAFT_418236 [Gloeopeniophorella convolvens]
MTWTTVSPSERGRIFLLPFRSIRPNHGDLCIQISASDAGAIRVVKPRVRLPGLDSPPQDSPSTLDGLLRRYNHMEAFGYMLLRARSSIYLLICLRSSSAIHHRPSLTSISMSYLEELLERMEKGALTDQDTRVLMCLALLQAIVELLLRAALVVLTVSLVPIIISHLCSAWLQAPWKRRMGSSFRYQVAVIWS